MMWHVFSYIYLLSLVKCLKIFGHVFSWAICFVIIDFKGALHILDVSSLSDMYFANIFFFVLFYHFLNSVFYRVFNFNKVQLTNFFFHELCF